MRKTALCVALALVACSKPAEKVAVKPAAADAAPAKPPAEEVPTREHHGIEWYDDTPEAALAAAAKAGKPVVVDMWAPWCHTCIAMQNYILTATNLPGAADRFVFLAVNTERPENAAFLQKVKVESWPTFYVLDGADMAIRGRWIGSGSPSQFNRFLEDGARAYQAGRSGALKPDDPLALLLEGDRLAAAGQPKEAAAKYLAAITNAPNTWPRRPDTLVALVSSLRKAEDYTTCAGIGSQYLEQTGNQVSAGDFAVGVLLCADGLPATDKSKKPLMQQIEKRLAALCDDPAAGFTPDDRADVCTYLQDVREKLGDKSGARKATERRIAVMEEAMKGLPDDVAVMYDWNLADAYLTLGRDADAIALLEKREKALPENYNPPHYLARTYLRLKKWDLGLAAIDRAIKLGYGPRRAGFLGVKVEILLGAGKKDEARKVLDEQLAAYRALPEGQKLPEREKAIEQRMAEWK